MAHITAYVPEHLFRRYQELWPPERSFSAWLQEHLAAELDAVAEHEPAGQSS